MTTFLNKIIRAGKVMVVCVSLVTMLVLTAVPSPIALAANPGDPLRLGEDNLIIDATTSLVGNSNPTLEIVNRSSTAGSPALRLEVNPKVSPLVVNDTAGKATNLDADKLDGRDSTTFADGTNGKANDADKLDGRDSTTFADGTNGKANDADKLDGKDSTTFANGTNGKANDADRLDGKDSTTFANGTNGKANDADRLDGKDSTTFANGTNGKANDADRLDGKDSLQFWSGKIYTVSSGAVTGQCIFNNNVCTISVSCDAGDALLSVSGGSLSGAEDFLVRTTIEDNPPIGRLFLNKAFPGNQMNADVRCADFPPLRP
jgi:hypothetical protein